VVWWPGGLAVWRRRANDDASASNLRGEIAYQSCDWYAISPLRFGGARRAPVARRAPLLDRLPRHAD
jgi:hypothetical protein